MNYLGFPLYSTIIKELEANKLYTDTPIEMEQKQFIMNNIKKIDKQGYEYIYCLIVSFYLDTKQTNADNIPFEGKQLKTGIKFNLDDLPNKLQKIIYNFIEKNQTQKLKN